ncbi:MAG: ribonuclease E/G [Pikeienuella sp.]
MKGRLIAIDPGPPAMAALVVDGRLEDLLVDGPDATAPRIAEHHRVGGRRLVPRPGAAAGTLAGGGAGWLREAADAAEGDRPLAAVTGVAEEGTATPRSGRRLHRGRFAILTPLSGGVNVARGVKDKDERARLTGIGEAALRGAAAGLILRTAARGAEEAEIAEEVAALLRREAALKAGGPPGLVLPAPGVADYACREWEANEIIEEPGVFDRLGLWSAIDLLRAPRAPLGRGAWMAVEPTAALVAVDVNTGADTAADAAARANLSAAADLPRQLRLRGLGGQVTVDFAPMRKADRKAVEAALSRALAADPVQTTIAGWTPLGHLEMIRKRERRPTAPLLPDA